MIATINPYLTFLGNCEEAFDFYKAVFGGEIVMMSRFSEMPPQDGMPIPDDLKDKIMHTTLKINESTLLMGSDTGGEWGADIVVGNNITLSITADSKDQADDFFAGLSEGGQVKMPMDKTFWGSYFGMCIDKFGINWMISFGDEEKSE